MPIASADIKYRLSGGATNTDPNASLGGVKSSTAVTDNVVDNLFDDIIGTEHLAGVVEYRCIYVHNGHASITGTNGLVWIAADVVGGDSHLSIAVGTAAVNGTEQTIVDETNAPTGVTWSDQAVSRDTGLALGDLPPGQHKAVWIRRTTTSGLIPQMGEGGSIQAGLDT